MKCAWKSLFLLLFFSRIQFFAGAQTGSIVIGSQEWMTENLNVDHYSDGTPIPEAKTMAEWKQYDDQRTGCYCNYDNEGCYGSMYGKLYNWYAVQRGLAAHCWRLPSKKDVDILISNLGENAGKKLKATHSWSNDWSGNNMSGFCGLAGGCRNPSGYFSSVGKEGFWWTNDMRQLNDGRKTGVSFFINYDDKCNVEVSENFGYSVRCMRDKGAPPPEPCP